MTDPNDPTEEMNPDDVELLADVQRIMNDLEVIMPNSAYVPCLFTMYIRGGRTEWCRIDAGRPHHIHVSRNGYYRWDDNGTVLETPHFASEAFTTFYAAHPDGQALWRPEDGPTRPGRLRIDAFDPPAGVTGFAAIRWHWKAYDALPPVLRRLRRTFLLAGFAIGLLITIAAICAVILAILLIVWFCVAYFGKWLTA